MENAPVSKAFSHYHLFSSSNTLSDVKNSILQKLRVCGSKWVKKLFYKIPISVVSIDVKYDTFVLAADEDIRVLFHCVRSFPEIRIHELYAKLEVGVESSGTSAPVHSSTAAGGASSLMPVAGPSIPQVASPSFTADLDRTEAVGSVPLENPGVWQQAFEVDAGGSMIHDVQAFREPDRHGPSSSGTQQYPRHFSTLNLEALDQQADGGAIIGGSSTEFQIGQSFQNKDEVVLSVKDYSIRRGVEYRVVESDHLKYHGRCKEFGKGCTWLIRISLRARKGTWEVRRYNGPHTCLATSISSDHRQLDYHVICARIFLLVRVDAAVTIKVLQQATEADYGFRLSYRKV
ncbi:uncharacterized protein LOC107613548 [Arachis ipaensis]|uniref:uncharacterized protein LOC107613548 n=1 Tax=Arachis ipaensis TaxID=130454 RepID=UPI0007AEF098|nr:uncharacterized protein LOC107613548 [Arachis ipaensis]